MGVITCCVDLGGESRDKTIVGTGMMVEVHTACAVEGENSDTDGDVNARTQANSGTKGEGHIWQ